MKAKPIGISNRTNRIPRIGVIAIAVCVLAAELAAQPWFRSGERGREQGGPRREARGVSRVVTVSPTVEVRAHRPARSDSGAAWGDLAVGYYADAIGAFTRSLERRPGDISARLGLAIALGANGNVDAGVSTMREVFRLPLPPGDLLPAGRDIRARVYEVAKQYRRLAKYERYTTDYLFMLSALAHVLNDDKGAIKVIAKAEKYGECDSSAVCLRERIETALYGGRVVVYAR